MTRTKLNYPRRHKMRTVLRFLTRIVVRILGRIEIEGTENLPETGPVILAPNHFSFVDPPLILSQYPHPHLIEFIGGAVRPNAPSWTGIFPRLWGIIHTNRGAHSGSTLKASIDVLEQGGVLCVFPEAGNWANVLRPARPGTAFIAAKSGAPVIPVSIVAAEGLLSWRRDIVQIIYHPPLHLPKTETTGKARRRLLDAFGEEIMAQIAAGLPDAKKGKYSSDPDARAYAESVSDYPFEHAHMRGN